MPEKTLLSLSPGKMIKLVCLSIISASSVFGVVGGRQIEAEIAQMAATKAAAQAEIKRKEAEEDAKEARNRADYRTQQEKLWEAEKLKRQRDALMENARQNSEAAKAVRSEPKNSEAAKAVSSEPVTDSGAQPSTPQTQAADSSASSSDWKPVEGNRINGNPVSQDPLGNKMADYGDGQNIYYQKSGESSWTIKPKEFGNNSALRESSLGGIKPEMTGTSINNGLRSVPQYQLPDGSKGFMDNNGNWQQRAPGNDFYTKTAMPEGFKANEYGQLVPAQPPSDLADLARPPVSTNFQDVAPARAPQPTVVPRTSLTEVLNYGAPTNLGQTLPGSAQGYEVIANRVGSIDLGSGQLRAFTGNDAALIVRAKSGRTFWVNGTLNQGKTPVLVPVFNRNGQWTVGEK